VARSFYCAGVRPGDLVHNAYGYGLFTGGLGAHDGAARLGCPVVPLSGGGTERQVALIMDFHPRVLCATPSYALALAEVAEQQGVDLRRSGLRSACSAPSPGATAMRERDRGAHRAARGRHLRPVGDHGPGRGLRVRGRNGLHGWEDHFLFETIDPDTGARCPTGEPASW
jgi:phenylacetate-CoA ligase